MNYTIDMFRKDFPNLDDEAFKSMKFRYAIALEDIDCFDGDYSDNRKMYRFTFARIGNVVGGGMFWVYKMNCKQSVKKNEVFICATSNHGMLHSVVKSTGIKTMPSINKLFKRKDGLDKRVSSYLFRKKWKRQQSIYREYNKRLRLLDSESHKVTKELNDNFHYLDFTQKEEEKVKFMCNVTKKKTRTEYGDCNELYSEDFVINYSPFSNGVTKYREYSEIENKFSNAEKFKDSSYPLYEIEHKGIIYLLEKSDFEYIEQREIKEKEVEYINKWEEKLEQLNNERSSLRGWLEQSLLHIESIVYQNYKNYTR